MKAFALFFFGASFSVGIIVSGLAEDKPESGMPSGSYLGEVPPGKAPKVFARGVISVDGTVERSFALSPQGDELFFTRGADRLGTWIMHMEKRGAAWSGPEPAAFLKGGYGTDPAFSPDGRRLYFATSFKHPGGEHFSIGRVNKINAGWAEPEIVIDPGGKRFRAHHPSVTREDTVYFQYWDTVKRSGDIYYSKLINGAYAKPVRLDPPVNSDYDEAGPTIDPDGNYLLFASNRPGGYGDTDVYVSYHNADDTWSAPVNLGPAVNTAYPDECPNISPDVAYWFYSPDGDIWWREAPVLPVALTGSCPCNK